MLRMILPGIVLSMSVFAGHAQKVSEYKFSVLNKTSGLAGNYVMDITQDHKGYIWLATEAGLQRYDGKRFLTFKNKPGDLSAIPYNLVEKIYEDKKQNLWIATVDDRIGIFNTSYFTYKEVPVPGASKESLMGRKYLLEDNDNNFFLAIGQQPKPFYKYSEKDKSFLPADLNAALPKGWLLTEMAFDKPANRLLMGTDSGLVVYDAAKRLSSYRGHNPLNDPLIAKLGNEKKIVKLYLDAQNNLWCITLAGPYEPPVIHRYEMNTGQYEKHIPFTNLELNYRLINSILTQKNGRTWICGLAFLMEFKKGQTPAFDSLPVNNTCNPKSLSFNNALTIFEDRDQTLWVGTTDGVIHFNPDASSFSSYLLQKNPKAAPLAQSPLSLLERKNGEIWVGCGNAGLYTLSKDFSPISVKGDPISKLASDKTVWSFHEDSRTGLIRMGYTRGQLAVYDPATGNTDIFAVPEFNGKPAHKIVEDKNGNLWFITRSYDSTASLVKWDRQLAGGDYKRGYLVVKSGKFSMASILIDSHNAVWLGGYGSGIQKFNAVTNAPELQILPEKGDMRTVFNDNSVADIIQYDDSTLVAVGTIISVINTKNNTVKTISKTDGLPGTIISVQKDKTGILWLGLIEGGICRFNMKRKIFTVYTTEDGLYNDYFNENGAYSLSDGRLVFNTSACIIAFRPEEVAKIASAPPAVITDFKLLNISLPIDSLAALPRIHLPYDKNSVTIEFSAMNFASQNKVNYYYQMEGLDNDWIPADETQKAIYNYLPNGRYTFRVKTDNGNTGQTAITSLAITVHAAFWKTWWFWGLIALIVASVLWLLDRERVKRLVLLQKMRTEIAVNLHKDISSTLNNINLLSEMARIKADKDLDRSKEYIQQISDKSNRMIVAMGDILWSIEPGNDSMEKSLLRMREFIDELKNRYNAAIELVADRNSGHVSLDMRKRHEFFLIFKDALRSVVELAEGRDTLIHLDATKTKLLLKLQDATAKPHGREELLREAIKSIENRAALINAETDIHYNHKGIHIIVQLPLT